MRPQTGMFLRIVAFVVLMFGVLAFGMAQHRWSERMLVKANAKRPVTDKLPLWGVSLFHSWRVEDAFRDADPAEFRRARIRFLVWGALLLAATVAVLGGIVPDNP